MIKNIILDNLVLFQLKKVGGNKYVVYFGIESKKKKICNKHKENNKIMHTY